MEAPQGAFILISRDNNMSARGLTSFYYFILTVYLVGVLGVSLFLILSNRRKTLKNLRFWLIASSGLVSIFLLLIVNSVSFFATSKYCIICHEMKPEFTTWKKSRHKNVDCISCHLNNEGAVGFIFEDIESLREVKNHITGNYPRVINANSSVSKKILTSKNCSRCHPQEQPIFVIGAKIRINHKKHKEAGISCPTCHNRVSHRGARGFNYLDGIRMMDGCMRCHTPRQGKVVRGKTAPTSCSVCHLDGKIGQKTFGKTSINKYDFVNCEACHKLRDPNIIRQFSESKMFKEEGLNCVSCHRAHNSKKYTPQPDPKRCNNCHEGFSKKVVRKQHGKEIKHPYKKSSEVRCSFCHPLHNFKAKI